MRSFTQFALLASTLLVKDAFAAPTHKRDLYMEVDTVVVTEEVTVQQGEDSAAFQATSQIATTTIVGQPTLVPSTSSSSTSVVVVPTPAPEPTSTSSTSVAPEASAAPVVFVQDHNDHGKNGKKPATTTTAAPKPIEEPATTAAPTTTSTTTSAAATTTAANAGGSSSGSKRGLAYNDATLLTAFDSSNKFGWAYNWGSGTATIPSDLNFTPMLWGLKEDNTKYWQKSADAAIAAGSTHLLAFNEPDLGAQSDLTPQQACDGYNQYMMPYAGKAKLVSPAVTNGGGNSMGLGWMKDFLNRCSGSQIDGVALHWYNGGDADAFKKYVTDFYAGVGNRPLHITEFQAPGSTDEQTAFLQEVIPWMDSSDMVERYAYFGVFDGNLVNGKSLSTLGEAFASIA